MNLYETMDTETLTKALNSANATVVMIKAVLQERESRITPTANENIWQTVDGFAVMIGDDFEYVETYEDALDVVNHFDLY